MRKKEGGGIIEEKLSLLRFTRRFSRLIEYKHSSVFFSDDSDSSDGKKAHELATGSRYAAGTAADPVPVHQHLLNSREVVEGTLLPRHLLVTELDDIQRLFRNFIIGMLGYESIVALLQLDLLLEYHLLLTLLSFPRALELSLAFLFGPVPSNLQCQKK